MVYGVYNRQQGVQVINNRLQYCKVRMPPDAWSNLRAAANINKRTVSQQLSVFFVQGLASFPWPEGLRVTGNTFPTEFQANKIDDTIWGAAKAASRVKGIKVGEMAAEFVVAGLASFAWPGK